MTAFGIGGQDALRNVLCDEETYGSLYHLTHGPTGGCVCRAVFFLAVVSGKSADLVPKWIGRFAAVDDRIAFAGFEDRWPESRSDTTVVHEEQGRQATRR